MGVKGCTLEGDLAEEGCSQSPREPGARLRADGSRAGFWGRRSRKQDGSHVVTGTTCQGPLAAAGDGSAGFRSVLTLRETAWGAEEAAIPGRPRGGQEWPWDSFNHQLHRLG